MIDAEESTVQPNTSERRLVLGVDGGGTASQVCLRSLASASSGSPDAQNMLEAEVGPLSVKSSGRDVVYANLKKLQGLLEPFENQMAAAVLGLSGLDTKEDILSMGRMLADAGIIPSSSIAPKSVAYGYAVEANAGYPVLLCSDAILPLFACGHDRGTVLIAGTGSVALRIKANGSVARFGGWGYRISDEGSGYWVGCRFARAALHAAENILAKGCAAKDSRQPNDNTNILPPILSDALQAIASEDAHAPKSTAAQTISGPAPFISEAQASLDMRDGHACARALCSWAMRHDSPRDYARLARYALKSSAPEAIEIRAEAARVLTRLALLAHDSHNAGSATGAGETPKAEGGASGPMVIAGSLFKNPDLEKAFRASVKNHSDAMIPIEKPTKPISWGALALAAQLARGEFPMLSPQAGKISAEQ